MTPRDEFIDFLVQYGGRCRDCADENGFCPQTGIGCGQRRQAVEFILHAIEYGAKNGFSSGYSIIHDSENHGPTVERAAGIADEKARGYEDPYEQSLWDGAKAIAARLRGLTESIRAMKGE